MVNIGIKELLLVGVGGGLGSIARFLTAVASQRFVGDRFALGTLLVNVVGSAILGFCMASLPDRITPAYRLLIMVGFLGGFTTFSTFAAESFLLANDRQWLQFALNVLLNNGLALAAAFFGYRLAERLYGV